MHIDPGFVGHDVMGIARQCTTSDFCKSLNHTMHPAKTFIYLGPRFWRKGPDRFVGGAGPEAEEGAGSERRGSRTFPPLNMGGEYQGWSATGVNDDREDRERVSTLLGCFFEAKVLPIVFARVFSFAFYDSLCIPSLRCQGARKLSLKR